MMLFDQPNLSKEFSKLSYIFTISKVINVKFIHPYPESKSFVHGPYFNSHRQITIKNKTNSV